MIEQSPEATLAVELRKVLDGLDELSSYDQVQACATAGGIVYRNLPVIIAALERVAAAEGEGAKACALCGDDCRCAPGCPACATPAVPAGDTKQVPE